MAKDDGEQFTDILDLRHDPELAAALGNMIVAWAYADSTSCGTLARVSGMNVNMAIMGFYRIPTLESRVKYIRAILLQWKTDEYDLVAIDKEVKAIGKLASTRNEWVHGVWNVGRKSGTSVVFNFRREEDKGRRKPVKAADVLNHVKTVQTHAKRLYGLVDMGSMRGPETADIAE